MDFFERIGDVISSKSKEAADMARDAADKAKDLAEIARLKSRIATLEEVIKTNYKEIGQMYYEKVLAVEGKLTTIDENEVEEREETAFLDFTKQRQAIENAKKGIDDLKEQIQKIRGE